MTLLARQLLWFGIGMATTVGYFMVALNDGPYWLLGALIPWPGISIYKLWTGRL